MSGSFGCFHVDVTGERGGRGGEWAGRSRSPGVKCVRSSAAISSVGSPKSCSCALDGPASFTRVPSGARAASRISFYTEPPASGLHYRTRLAVTPAQPDTGAGVVLSQDDTPHHFDADDDQGDQNERRELASGDGGATSATTSRGDRPCVRSCRAAPRGRVARRRREPGQRGGSHRRTTRRDAYVTPRMIHIPKRGRPAPW